MTEQNAFVTRLADGGTFRFHHMMKSCAERAFRTLRPEKQRVYGVAWWGVLSMAGC